MKWICVCAVALIIDKEIMININSLANWKLALAFQIVSNWNADVILEFYPALVRPYLDYIVQYCCHIYRKDIDPHEQEHRRMMKSIQGFTALQYKKKKN